MVLPQSSVMNVDLARIAFGQTIAVTGIQLASATAAAINGGYYYTPYIVSEIFREDGSVVERIYPKLKNKVISEQSDSFFELKEATLYTSFRRLEDAQYITSYWGDENSGARRRYYSITENGKKYLEENINDWQKIKSLLEKVLTTNINQ